MAMAVGLPESMSCLSEETKETETDRSFWKRELTVMLSVMSIVAMEVGVPESYLLCHNPKNNTWFIVIFSAEKNVCEAHALMFNVGREVDGYDREAADNLLPEFDEMTGVSEELRVAIKAAFVTQRRHWQQSRGAAWARQ